MTSGLHAHDALFPHRNHKPLLPSSQVANLMLRLFLMLDLASSHSRPLIDIPLGPEEEHRRKRIEEENSPRSPIAWGVSTTL